MRNPYLVGLFGLGIFGIVLGLVLTYGDSSHALGTLLVTLGPLAFVGGLIVCALRWRPGEDDDHS